MPVNGFSHHVCLYNLCSYLEIDNSRHLETVLVVPHKYALQH